MMKTLERADDFIYVGKDVIRIDALDKVSGAAKYFADLYSSDMLLAKVLTSRYPHATLKHIDSSRALKLQGIKCVISAEQIPGVNNASYLIEDQPLLAEGKVRYEGEPIAIVVGVNESDLLSARDLIQVDYEPLPAVFDGFEAAKNKVLVHDSGNIVFEERIVNGDVVKGFNESSVVVEDKYETQWQDHGYVEREGAIAIPTETGVRIIGVQQHPHLAQMVVARVLGLKLEQVEVICPIIGGGFGGKDDVGPWVCAQAALAAYWTKRPVLLSYDREQSFLIRPKRFPFHIEYKSGAGSDGKLKAIDVRILVDTGAYSNRGPFVLFRGMLTSSGPYEVPNAIIHGRVVYTNKVFGGSFRGFGNPEVQFAAESQMEKLAAKLGIDPIDFRLNNILKPGSITAFGQRLDDDVGLKECLQTVVEKSAFRRKRSEYGQYNATNKTIKKGIGVACVFYGSAITAYRPDGSPRPDWSSVSISVKADGKVEVMTGIVEMGQGTHTAIAQIVSEVLGLSSLDHVSISCSTKAPDTWATHSSRGTAYGSSSVYPAAVKLREKLAKFAAEQLICSPEEVRFEKGYVFNRMNSATRLRWEDVTKGAIENDIDLAVTETVWHKPRGEFDPKTLTGFIYPSISYCAFVSEVQVDTENGLVKVERVWPAISCGRIINPVGAKQQIVGAFTQGVGLSLMEEVKIKDGLMQNPSFLDYLIPRSTESPAFEELVFIEIAHPEGTLGAKGLGEIGIIAAPPSISNAISNAIGRPINELPITPERVHSLLKEAA
jgi:CO/xanthine dehydrogenase Mo-binding subunit